MGYDAECSAMSRYQIDFREKVDTIDENVDPDGLLNIRLFLPTVRLFHVQILSTGHARYLGGLKKPYQAEACVLIPGGGTFAMEAIARHLAAIRITWWFAMAGLAIVGQKLKRAVSPNKQR